MKNLLVCFASIVFLLQGGLAWGEQAVDFAREILPILSNKCFICHGPDSREKDNLRLDSFEGATADLDGHQAINPKQPEKSEILARINDAESPMPPEDAEKKLTDGERKLISRWVREGGTYAKHWSFVVPKKAASQSKEANPVDGFIADGLKKTSKSFAQEAQRDVLARRVALVLTGLPPEPAQLQKFLADKSPGAYEKLVDELLANRKYGEHQARYWLDAVRYGDTHGLHLDNRRGIYSYRDWVIYTLNQNQPLDEFITWQLAGDLLPNPTLAQRVATGFVRMNPTTAEGGAIPQEFQAKNNFDRTETLGTVLLGMSLTCARCHTHKYDPIPQTEYYKLFAFFNSTSESSMDGNSYTYGPVLKAPASVTAWSEWESFEADADRMIESAQKTAAGLPAAEAKKWQTANKKARLNMLAAKDGPLASLKLQDEAAGLVAKMAKAEAAFTTTLVTQELPKPRTTQVLQRGEYNLPVGDPLQPGVFSVMGAFPEDAPNNRLGLAQWLTSREHPLVSRVWVNRIWQRTFGDGLVRTPEDFGLQGKQPSHPELLDWLAVELQDSGWDLKHILRLMVTSKTFKQSSEWRNDIDDPENKLFARGPSYRLDAEVIRDIALWSSNLLNEQMGGEGIKPYQPGGLWKALAHPGSNTKQYVKDSGDKLYRRSLYVYWKRTSPHPMMMLFDAPSREASCVRRSRTNTPLQSLGLLNETQRLEMSRKLAERLLQQAEDDTSRMDLLFTLLASRKPSDAERAACDKLLNAMRNRYNDSKEDAVALLSTGDAPRNNKLDPIEQAAWAQVAITVLASDVSLLLY
jgi:hypothetical protein